MNAESPIPNPSPSATPADKSSIQLEPLPVKPIKLPEVSLMSPQPPKLLDQACTELCRSARAGHRSAPSQPCWMISTSMAMLTVSPTSHPPVSNATFHVRPKSLRLILVRAVNPALTIPHGLLA